MKSDEKDKILKQFSNHHFDVLVSTTVIEVGIDVPNATLMVIEHPERLGLSQLHQLRGRIGRGEKPSTCILLGSQPNNPRLNILCQTSDGFKIAEEDLALRGPGEFLGTRQSGLLGGFRVANLIHDAPLLEEAKNLARHLVSQSNPSANCPLPPSPIIKKVVQQYKTKIAWLQSG